MDCRKLKLKCMFVFKKLKFLEEIGEKFRKEHMFYKEIRK